ncbi:DUF2339 domain-containing protein [Aquimarina addita]|uniref:DUF2339 domain-containing protein n=1 Tax=Aquimarina addita TaxID=870485 RepID=A0ABP6UKT3_9FLAO
MEFSFILLLILLIVLIHFKVTLKGRINDLQKNINDLNDKLDKVLKTNSITKKVVSKEETKNEIVHQENKPATPVKPTQKEEAISIKPVESEKAKPIKAAEISPLTPIPEKVKPVGNIKEQLKNEKPIYTKQVKKQIQPPRPGFWQRFKEKNPDLEKFIGENLINKIGILILVLGISYFVKYAIDKDWINETGRVGIGILAGSLVLAVAHKLRKKYNAFSSVLVSGAIAIFYFTIAIGFHEYQLFSQTVAFVIMVFITTFSCLISMSYNRIELAVLSLIGGFAVPFMIRTGNGNYLVLFSYIAILDIGILALAYFKKWNLVNILAFIFTTLLFIGWFSDDINNVEPHYTGAFIFSLVFYMIFIVMNIIHNIRNKGIFTKTQLTILSINTFIFYGIGMIILSAVFPIYRGLFTAILAILNLMYAWVLYKKFGLDKTAIYLLIGLTLSFITLAIPIQFEGNNITLFWAAEGVLLIWLAQKSKIRSYRFASGIVHILMLFSLLIDWIKLYTSDEILMVVGNAAFITGIVSVISLISVWYLLRNEIVKQEKLGFTFNPVIYRKIAVIVSIVLGYFVGILEVLYQSYMYFDNELYSLFTLPVVYHLLFSAVFCFFLHKRKNNINHQLATVLIIINIIVFVFLFSRLPFLEQKGNLILVENSQLAFYMHYICLLIIGYFCYLLFKINKKSGLFKSRIMIWVTAFVLVYLASSELILHGLKFMNPQLSDIAFTNDSAGYYNNRLHAARVINLAKFKIIKTGLPVLWGIMAFIFLLIGIKKSIKDLRIIALSLLGLTILKLFIYDISNVSETGKIIAFILLGVLVLIISFVYQKIKVLVIDEKTKPEDDQTVT